MIRQPKLPTKVYTSVASVPKAFGGETMRTKVTMVAVVNLVTTKTITSCFAGGFAA